MGYFLLFSFSYTSLIDTFLSLFKLRMEYWRTFATFFKTLVEFRMSLPFFSYFVHPVNDNLIAFYLLFLSEAVNYIDYHFICLPCITDYFFSHF
jgi:hypothetical protein